MLFVALCLGLIAGLFTWWGTRCSLQHCGLAPGKWPLSMALAGVVLSVLFVMSVLSGQAQNIPEVQPDQWAIYGRMVFHLSLIVLLLMITATDLRSYYILDWTCWLGMGIAVLGAVASGQFQLAHVWVDWNAEVPQISGPYLPAWLSTHQHLHGLAWSLAGLVCGVVITAGIRWISAFVLQMPTLGMGDVFLMAMVGAYLGWQPTVVVLLLAPVLALVIGAIVRLRGNHAILPYGPFLALATLFVLFFWRSIWMAEVALTSSSLADRHQTFAVRRFFGDPMTMLMTVGLALALMVVLLGLLRIYKSFPVRG